VIRPDSSDEEVRGAALELLPRFVERGEFGRADRYKLIAHELGANRQDIEEALAKGDEAND
jgi:hypothetical protein